jgi:cobalt-zinc-cadmium efflux system outer membrane protein
MPTQLRPNRLVRRLAGVGLLAGLSGCLTPNTPDRIDFPAAGPTPRPVTRGQVGQPDPTGKKPDQLPQPKPDRPDVPPGLPGAEARFRFPEVLPDDKAERLKLINELFPPLPALGPDPLVDATPERPAVSFDELLEFAKRNSPVIAQAAADVREAQGRWVQAGLYPNPTMGFQGDQIADVGPFGQFGGYFNQTIVTAGKLQIARAVVYYDYLNARLRLRRAEVELTRQLRSDYLAGLVAADNVRISRLVTQFTEEVYQRQVGMARGGLSTPAEAAALRAVTNQTRANLIVARNRYVSSWKQLAATANAPDMPPAPLAGRIAENGPRYNYDALRARMLAGHTDIAVARYQITQAERSLTQERRRPIPDLQNNFYLERDTLAQSLRQPSVQFGAQVGVTVPLWNRNQGAIQAAEALLVRSSREEERVRNDLIRQLADAFERYETGRQLTELYREQILPDLARAFRGVYQRYQFEVGVVNYNDIVTAQQNLAAALGNYLQALQQQWQAAADLAGVVQVDRLDELPTDPGPDSWPDAAPRK